MMRFSLLSLGLLVAVAHSANVMMFEETMADLSVGSCTNCAAGKTCIGSSCTNCAAGKSSSASQAARGHPCSSCAAGKHSPSGSSGCTNCAAGKTSSAGASCTNCAAGKSSTAGGSCSSCALGKHSAGGDTCTSYIHEAKWISQAQAIYAKALKKKSLAGAVLLTGKESTVTFGSTAGTVPVVIAQIQSYNGEQPAHIRIKSVSTTNFKYWLEEWEYQDMEHSSENIQYLAMEEGMYTTGNSKILVVKDIEGDVDSANTTKDIEVTFGNNGFFGNSVPVVFAMMQTYDGSDPAVVRVKDVTKDGFTFNIVESEKKRSGGGHNEEKIGYIAVTPSGRATYDGTTESGITDNNDAGKYSDSFKELTELKDIGTRAATANADGNGILVDMQTINGANTCALRMKTSGGDIKVEEETSDDEETSHTGTERLGWFKFPNPK